jgi:hypothetical protein
MATLPQLKPNTHVRIVVAEGKVTLEDLHSALDTAVKHVVRGGCNCGLTGFDISFVRGDPVLTEMAKVPNIQVGTITHG